MKLSSLFGRRSAPAAPIHWITDDIAISGAPPLDSWPSISEAGIRAVLDLRGEAAGRPRPAVPDVEFHFYPLEEGSAPEPAVLDELAAWVIDRLQTAGPVLIHCREGRGRSAMVACAVLINLGHSVKTAYELVRRGRPAVAMSDPQVEALQGFAAMMGRN